MRRSIKVGIIGLVMALLSVAALSGSAPAGAAEEEATTGGGEAHCPIYVPTFADVQVGHPFYTEIYWLVNEGVINGFHVDCTFRSTNPASRQAMAAWLYRFKLVDPAFVPPVVPTFLDTPVLSQFYTEIEWLVTTGVTTGYTGAACTAVAPITTSPCFRPTRNISRQAMAAFLYRYAGSPAFVPPVVATYADTPVGSPFFLEVEWLVTTGITTGYTGVACTSVPTTSPCFKPTIPVSRQATAAFLYRYHNTAALPRLASLSDAAAPAGGGAAADGGSDAAAPAGGGGSAAVADGGSDAAAPAAAGGGSAAADGGSDAAAPAAGGSDAAASEATTGGASADADAAGDDVALGLTDASTTEDSSSGLLVRGGAVALVAAGLLIAATRRRNSTIS